MKNTKLIIFVFLICSNIFSEETKPLSLKKFWILAEKNSPGLKARIKQIESIQHSIDALPSWYKPNIYADLGYTGAVNQDAFKHGPLARLVAEFTLWDGGRTHYTRLFGQKKAESAKWQQVLLTMDLKKSIASVYYKTARLEELQSHYADKIEHFNRLSRLLRPRLRIGKIGNSDLTDVQIRLSQLSNKQETIKATSLLMRQQLNLFIGRDDEKGPTIPSLSKLEAFDESSDAEVIFSSLPAYKLSQAKIKSLEAELQLTRRNLYWPSFGIETYGGYGPHIDAITPQKPEVGVGLKFKVPLYSTRDRGSTLSAKKAEIKAAKLDLQQNLIQARMEFNLKLGKIQSNKIQLTNLENIIEKGTRNLNLAYKEFSRGLKSPTDMLTAIQTLFDIKDEYIHVRMQWLNFQTELYLLGVYAKNQMGNK